MNEEKRFSKKNTPAAEAATEAVDNEKVVTKKGRNPWRHRAHLDTPVRIEGSTLRWVKSEPDRLETMVEEGWVPVSKTTNKVMDIDNGDLTINDSKKPINGAYSRRELTLMALSNEDAEARREYYHDLAMQRVKGNLSQAKSFTAPDGSNPFAEYDRDSVANGGNKSRIVIE